MTELNLEQIKDQAKAKVKEILVESASFKSMPFDEQKKVYQDVLNEQMQLLTTENESDDLSSEMAGRKTNFADKASNLIDDKRHEKNFDDGVDAFEDLVDSVDFPKFVGDLLKSVFDANISVMKSQTTDYIRLMKQATTGLATFIKQIDNTTTFAYLAENNSDDFGFTMEEDGDGGEKMQLTNPKGEKVDIEDNEVKVKIMDAKIKMAQEHRAALREMILMGVTRLVVEKGEIEAEVNFEFKAHREVDKKDKALLKTAKSSGKSLRASRGLIGSIFGGPSGGYADSSRQTQLSVSSTKSTSTDDLKAKLRGYVNIKFKTDYFKLDNFAQMYGPASQEAKKAATGE